MRSTARLTDSFVVVGEVVGVHIDESYVHDGLFDAVMAGNVARLGYFDYSSTDRTFSMRRPRWGERTVVASGDAGGLGPRHDALGKSQVRSVVHLAVDADHARVPGRRERIDDGLRLRNRFR
jgi:hypothetical protein